MLKIEQRAQENPQQVRDFAEKCDEPLRSGLLRIIEEVENDDQ